MYIKTTGVYRHRWMKPGRHLFSRSTGPPASQSTGQHSVPLWVLVPVPLWVLVPYNWPPLYCQHYRGLVQQYLQALIMSRLYPQLLIHSSIHRSQIHQLGVLMRQEVAGSIGFVATCILLLCIHNQIVLCFDAGYFLFVEILGSPMSSFTVSIMV